MQYTRILSTSYADSRRTGSVLKAFFPLLLLLMMLALAGCSTSQPPSSSTPTATGSGGQTPSSTPGSGGQTPSSTTGATPTTGPATVAATASSYYQAIQAQNYTSAYSFLDANIVPLNGQALTQQVYTQVAQFRDSQYGPVASFTVLVSTTDPTAVVMTVSRKGGLRYHTHLKFKQEGSEWKIVTLDGI